MEHSSEIRVSRRTALGLVASGAGALVLAACSSGAPGASAQPTAGAAAATTPAASSGASGAPKQGGMLNVASPDVATLDGHVLFAQSIPTLWAVYDRLTQYDAKGQPQPMLAESWEVSPDAKKLTLHLRKGVQFHTGREFTSDDVKYNILRVRDPKVAVAQLAFMSSWWSAIDTPDKNTLVLSSDQARPGAFDFLEFLNILDKDTQEGPNAKTKQVGTGPFAFVEYVTGDHMTLTKNKNYWMSGRPFLDGITFKFTNNSQATDSQLEGGGAELANQLLLRDGVRLQKDPKYQVVYNANGGGWPSIIVNVNIPPLDNKKVRQALNYAIDRQRFSDTIMLGTVKPTDIVWSESSPAYEASKVNAYAFNLDKAQSLLQEAGVTSAEFDLLVNLGSPDLVPFAQIYQADLAKIGLKANITQADQAAWADQTAKVTYKGISLTQAGFANLGPTTLFALSHNLTPQNNEGFSDPTYTQLLNSVSTEPDLAKQKQIFSQLNDFLLDQSFVMMFGQAPLFVVGLASLHGVSYAANGAIKYWDVALGA